MFCEKDEEKLKVHTFIPYECKWNVPYVPWSLGKAQLMIQPVCNKSLIIRTQFRRWGLETFSLLHQGSESRRCVLIRERKLFMKSICNGGRREHSVCAAAGCKQTSEDNDISNTEN